MKKDLSATRVALGIVLANVIMFFLVMFGLFAMLVLAIFFAKRAEAATPWTPVVAARVVEVWPDVVQVADEYGVDPVTLAAQAAVETGLRGLRGKYNADVWGVGQISWKWHGRRLRAAGIAEKAQDLLLFLPGLRAQALVLRYVLGLAPKGRALCAFGAGSKPLRERWVSCRYSRTVEAYEDLVRAALVELAPRVGWVQGRV